MDNAQNVNTNAQDGKKKPKVKITKGKLGSKAKKKGDVDEDELARLAAAKKNAIEIKGMEEMHWRVTFKILALERLRKKIEQDGRGNPDEGKKKKEGENA